MRSTNRIKNDINLLLNRDWDFTNEKSDEIYNLHPYPAKFIPNIPKSLIQDLGVPENTVVFDPFCGYGTTLIAAQEMGYSSIGVDINPIACLISRVTTRPCPPGLITTAMECIEKAKKNDDFFPYESIPNINHWFNKSVQITIAKLVYHINLIEDELLRDALRLALSSIIVRVSNQDSNTRYAAVDKNVLGNDVYDLFERACNRYSRILKNINKSLLNTTVLNKDILTVKKKDLDAPIGLVVCSPPYPNAYEYWLYHKYRMWWLGLDPLFVKEREIGARPHYFKKNPHGPEDFRRQMTQVFNILTEVCVPNANICFILGDSKIHGEIIDNTKLLIEAASTHNFEPKAIIPRSISSSRKSFNLSHARRKNENIIVFQKKSIRKKSKSVNLYWHNYKYFPYERKFALKEISTIPGIKSIKVNQENVEMEAINPKEEYFNRLVYFAKYEADSFEGETKQGLLEKSALFNGTGKKQSTRYSVHGLHEYKGKFNPQVVRGIINWFDLPENSQIIDPFLGSGTTLIESMFAGHHGYGWDLNPFAVYLSNAKLLALKNQPSVFSELTKDILTKIKTSKGNVESDDERYLYLQKWFPKVTLNIIENVRMIISETAGNLSPIYKILFSNLLRDYSLQEPSDLRIRRRKSPFPKIKIIEAYEKTLGKFLYSLTYTSKIFPKMNPIAEAVQADGRSYEDVSNKFKNNINANLAITSPPYATALPYIDTQRLSLIWLDLLAPIRIKAAERSLIGSREASAIELRRLVEDINNNALNLPESIVNFCSRLQNQLNSKDGFRRQAVPSLLYRYFSDMKLTFSTVLKLMDNESHYVLIVGTNTTTIGGKKEIISTPRFLTELAKSTGWTTVEKIQLETYKRYGLHAANSIRNETLLVFKK